MATSDDMNLEPTQNIPTGTGSAPTLASPVAAGVMQTTVPVVSGMPADPPATVLPTPPYTGAPAVPLEHHPMRVLPIVDPTQNEVRDALVTKQP